MTQCARARRRRAPGQDASLPVQDLVHDIHAVEARSEAPTEVLQRDQRTVRVPVEPRPHRHHHHYHHHHHHTRTCRPPRRTSAPLVQCQCEHQPLVCDHRFSVRPPQCRIRRQPTTRSSSWFPAGSAIRWFLSALCVLALLPARTMAAPTQPRPEQWINPCGTNKQDAETSELDELNMATPVLDLIGRVNNSAGISYGQAKQFREEYVRRTFGVDLQEHHNSWKTYNFSWLPQLPKHLGEQAPDEHLQTLEFDDALRDIYQYLQKYAVGMEQIVKDQTGEKGYFSQQFSGVEARIKSLLCEVQWVMAERGVTQHPDVTRDIMSREYREYSKNEKTYRNLRDWLIFRDYMNALEYIQQLMLHLKNKQLN